jgi:hypothetical protein
MPARRNSLNRGTSFHSFLATEPITAILHISGKAAQASVTTSAAILNSRWRANW